jgi:D-alanine-D-alanine ligase
VLFGGRSAEHDVSIMSAANVMQAIDPAKYEVVPIRIERDGRWLLHRFGPEGSLGAPKNTGLQVALMPGGSGALVTMSPVVADGTLPEIDVIFPVLHGPYGEDGSVQGLAETAGIAYVGCGVASSAICMDKDLTKRLLVAADVPMARSLTMRRGMSVPFETVKRELGMPVFVKPARQGSSFGVGKADSPQALATALANAFEHDDKLLIEEFVPAREIECAVLEKPDGSLVVSDPGEIITTASHQFYTYEAKYLDTGGTVVRTPADVPDAVRKACRETAAKAFRTLECSGMARVDFFLRKDGELLLNEVNTIPGFTNMSMYPKALESGGVSCPEAVDTLIQTAIARHSGKAREA